MSEPTIQKERARKAAAKRRAGLFAAHPGAGEKLAAHVIAGAASFGLEGRPRTVSVFWSMGDEIDTRPLLSALHQAGHTTALPVVAAKAQPLVFRAWAPEDALVSGGFGTSVPSPGAPQVVPDILFVPLLSFDEAGYRLGYGGGFYDRTLQNLRRDADDVMAIGIAFSGQRVDTVPRGPYDQPLDGIATEAGLMLFGGKGTS
jgi:5-formyltetrahydrofolate cyclo-ligase